MKAEANQWKCPACGFVTVVKASKKDHLKKTKNDPYHFAVMRDETIYRSTLLSQIEMNLGNYTESYLSHLFARRLNC